MLRCTCEVGFGRIKDMKMMLDKKKIVRITNSADKRSGETNEAVSGSGRYDKKSVPV